MIAVNQSHREWVLIIGIFRGELQMTFGNFRSGKLFFANHGSNFTKTSVWPRLEILRHGHRSGIVSISIFQVQDNEISPRIFEYPFSGIRVRRTRAANGCEYHCESYDARRGDAEMNSLSGR